MKPKEALAMCLRLRFTLSALVLVLTPVFAQASTDDLATVSRRADGLSIDVTAENAGTVLSLTGPGGYVSRQEIPAGRAPFVAAAGLADGFYRFELVISPKLDPTTRRALAAARQRGDDTVARRLVAEGKIPAEAQIVGGYFTVAGGTMLVDGPEPTEQRAQAAAGAAGEGISKLTANLDVTNNLFVHDSACIGFDCVLGGESFGTDTIRLKENTTRIKFDDTSTTAGFPNRDWQLVANDQNSGGANKFSIEDVTGARTPFTIEAAAPTNSIFVDDTGRLGLGTGTPVLDVHVASGNTPALRLEQDASSGFTAQTWDVAGNEANFFVRDVTGGSRLSFRIRPGAPSSSIDISSDGDVGIGTASPAASLHVRRTDGTALVEIEEASATEAAREMLSLTNNGRVNWRLTDTSANGQDLTLRLAENDFDISFSAIAGDEFSLSENGNLLIAGTLTENSDRDKKTNIVPVDPAEVLAKVSALPIARWTYKLGDPNVTHLGPMAQDFHALFGLGADERHIATIDTSGVALAAIQALNQVVEAKQAELDALKTQNDALLARLEALEAKVR